MSKKQSDNFLRYGQGILIQGFKGGSDPDIGLVTAKGYADIKVRYQTYDDLLYFKNYRNSIFQILPAGNFQINDELQKIINETQQNTNQKQIEILKARAISEQIQFELNITNKQTNKICFGNCVIFKHIDSQSYVSGTIKPSNGSNGAFTVQMSSNLSESLIFKVLPYRSFECLGMQIPLQSPIILKNSYNNGYLTFEKLGIAGNNDQKSLVISKKPIKSDESYKIPVKTTSKASKDYQCVTHFVDLSVEKQAPMPWSLVLHVNQVENDVLIQHDVVYLQHTQNYGLLSINNEEIILKELKDQACLEPCFYQCFWEIQEHDQTQNSYILRHLISGMTLGVTFKSLQRGQQQVPDRPILIDISHGKEGPKLGSIQLKFAKKQSGIINSLSLINICWEDSILGVAQGNQLLEIEQVEPINESETLIDLEKMKKIQSKQVEYCIRSLNFKRNIQQQHCFMIMEIDDVLKNQLLFALSFHSIVIKLREDLEWGSIQAAKKISYLRMMQVCEKIEQIKYFLKDCENNSQVALPIFKRQMICKDLGVSQLLFELLYFMKMNLKQDIFVDKHYQHEKFIEMYHTIYEVIYQLIYNNRLFKIHISKWIVFILEDVTNDDQQCYLQLLCELLRQNQMFVNNFVDQNFINYLMQGMKTVKKGLQYSEIKYLKIMRLLCVSGQSTNISNQLIILEKFLKQLKKDYSEIFKIQLHYINDIVNVKSSIDKKNIISLKFQTYYEETQIKNPSAWSYFVQYLNLVADIAKGRNLLTRAELKKMFSLEMLNLLFQNQKMNEAQVPIIRLLHYLYAESTLYYPIDLQNLVVNYNELQDDSTHILTTSSKTKPWQSILGQVLVRMLQKLSQQQQINPSQMNKNLVLFQILDFLKSSLRLGLWLKKQQVKNILQCVLKMLDPPQSLQDYQQLLIRTENNLLMLKCKLQCINIVHLIVIFDINLTTQAISSTFKTYSQKIFTQKTLFFSDDLELQVDKIASQFLQMIQKINQVEPLIQTNICDRMLELVHFRHPELTSKAMEIIDNVIQNRKVAIKHFKVEKFISDPNSVQFFNYITENRNVFLVLKNNNMSSITKWNKLYLIENQQKNGLMQIIYILSQLMKNENQIDKLQTLESLRVSGIYDILGTDRLINFTGERSSSDFIKQKIVYCSGLHHEILSYIFNCQEMPTEELSLKLLHLCYKFIVCLIQNYNDIKVQMLPFIPKMIHHVHSNVGVIDFLKQMYDNNKNMLYNQIFTLIKEVCDTLEEQPQDSYYRCKLLDFFRYLIYCNGQALKSNQIQILKIMQDDSYKKIIITISTDHIRQLVQEFQQKNKYHNQVVLIMPQLLYLITYFQILVSLIDDNNTVNMGKLTKRFRFGLLVQYLEVAGSCWPLKRNIRAFLNRLYYFQTQIETNLKKIVEIDIQNIIIDLNLYLEIKINSDANQELRKFQNPIRFSYLESYLYLNLEECLFTLFHLVTRQPIQNQIVKYLNSSYSFNLQLSYDFIKISERLSCIRNYYNIHKNINTNTLIKFILKKFANNILNVLNNEIYLQGYKSDLHDLLHEKDNIQNAKQFLIKKIINCDIAIFYQEKRNQINQNLPISYILPNQAKKVQFPVKHNHSRLLDKLRNIFIRVKKDFTCEDQRLDYSMNRVVQSLKRSAKTQSYYFQSYSAIINPYCNNISIYDYITTIIQMNSQQPEALPAKLKIFLLDMITHLVQISNNPKQQSIKSQVQNNKKDISHTQSKQTEKINNSNNEQQDKQQFRKRIDEWQAEDWQSSAQNITKVQNKLKNCKLGQFITDLLKQNITDNIQFANSILLCAIGYLLGGNELTQKNLIQEMSNDRENRVLNNIRLLIEKLGKLILKNIGANRVKQTKKNAFQPITIDNYDYYDSNQKCCLRKNVSQPNSVDEYIYHQLCIVTYRRAFKFLQLLCQNNNIEGKDFIREQKGQNRPCNFITLATKQLRRLFQVMCLQISDVPIFLLDFILQVTQIPVISNQQVLMNSTFFEDLCQMSNYFAIQGNLDLCDFKSMDPIWEIYFKSVQIILSNFEGNSFQTYSLFDSKLQSKFLSQILQDKLKQLEIRDKTSLIEYIKKYNSEKDQKGQIRTTFSAQLTQIFDIVIIFMKLKDVLKEKSRVVMSYERLKKDHKEEYLLSLKDQFLKDESVKDQQKRIKDEIQCYQGLFEYLEKCLINIEINDFNGNEQTIWFPKFPVFKSLSHNLRDEIMSMVVRETHRDKIVSLLDFKSTVKEKIEYSYNLQKNEKISQKSMKDSYKYASILSILVCLHMMLFYDVFIEYENAEFASDWNTELTALCLSLFQLYWSFYYAYYWYKLKIWHKPESKPCGESEPLVQSQQQQFVSIATLPEPEQPTTVREKIVSKIKKTKAMLIKLREGDEEGEPNNSNQTQKIYQNGEFYRIALFVGSAAIGTLYYPPIFFIHLIDIFCNLQTLGFVFAAIAHKIQSLLYVSFMAVVFTLIFCTVTFSNYMKNVYGEQQSLDEMCEGMIDCVMSLYVSGAIGETMQTFQMFRFIYDMIYITYFGLLFGNIVSGIMLDAFGSLRSNSQALLNDKKNVCYICNIPRETLEKRRETFDSHKKKHFLWNYIFYILTLERKNETDYTGLQYYILKKYKLPDEEMDVSWVPSKGQSEFDTTSQVTQLISNVHSYQQNIATSSTGLQESIKQFDEIAEQFAE